MYIWFRILFIAFFKGNCGGKKPPNIKFFLVVSIIVATEKLISTFIAAKVK